MPNARINDTPSANNPATERVRSSAHVSWAWRRMLSWYHAGALSFALVVRFLRVLLPPLPPLVLAAVS